MTPVASDVVAAEPTVTEIIAELRADGFSDDFFVDAGMLRCGACGEAHRPEETGAERIDLVEGSSDPADSAAVLALGCSRCGVRGVLVTAYGPAATAEEAAVLTALVDRRDSAATGHPSSE